MKSNLKIFEKVLLVAELCFVEKPSCRDAASLIRITVTNHWAPLPSVLHKEVFPALRRQRAVIPCLSSLAVPIWAAGRGLAVPNAQLSLVRASSRTFHTSCSALWGTSQLHLSAFLVLPNKQPSKITLLPERSHLSPSLL